MMQSRPGAAEAARLRGKWASWVERAVGIRADARGLWMADPEFSAQYVAPSCGSWPPPEAPLPGSDPSPNSHSWSQSDMMQLGHHSRKPPQRGGHLPMGSGRDDERHRHQVDSEAPTGPFMKQQASSLRLLSLLLLILEIKDKIFWGRWEAKTQENANPGPA